MNDVEKFLEECGKCLDYDIVRLSRLCRRYRDEFKFISNISPALVDEEQRPQLSVFKNMANEALLFTGLPDQGDERDGGANEQRS